jgi:hypothetical protein
MSTPWTARRTTTRVAVEFDFVKPLTALKGFGFQRGQLRLDESRQTPKPLSLGSRQNSSGRAWPLLNSTKRQSSIKKPAASGEDAAGAGANPGRILHKSNAPNLTTFLCPVSNTPLIYLACLQPHWLVLVVDGW